jgi:hypothetical protein
MAWAWYSNSKELEIQDLKDKVAQLEDLESSASLEGEGSSTNFVLESATLAKPTTNLDTGSIQAKPQASSGQTSVTDKTFPDSIQGAADVQIIEAKVQETILEDGSGVFILGLLVSSPEKDIYIPQTTTDSTNGYTAFSYTVEGDDFRGIKNSKIDCTLRHAGQCKIKAGQTKQIFVTVWLYPDLPGDYAVRFKDFGYRYGLEGSLIQLPINKSTETVYLNYI